MSLEGFARHTIANTHVHGRSWLNRIRWSGVCTARRAWQQLPTTYPVLLPPLLLQCLSHASSSKDFQGFSQKSSNHSMGMYLHNICSLYCAQQLPTFCFLASFQLHLTYLVFCLCSNTTAQHSEHFRQGGTKFQVAAL